MSQKIVFTLNTNGALGCLPECMVVDTDEKGVFQTHFVRVGEQNKTDHLSLFDATELQLLDCCLRLEKSYIVSKIKDRFVKDWDDLINKYFSNKKVSPDKLYIKDYLLDYIETIQNRFFELVADRKLYLPIGRFPFTWNEITLAEEMPELLYCFDNTPERINYTLAVSCENKPLSLLKALLITRKTARILIKNKIYEFDTDVDGAKLMPFLDKQKVSVSLANAEEYINKVIVPLVNTNKVLASGFEIEVVNILSNAILKVREIAPIHQFSLFDDGGENSTEKSLVIELIFEYGLFQFWAGQSGKTTHVEFSENSFTILKAERDKMLETLYIDALQNVGLNLNAKVVKMPYNDGVEWINDHYRVLESTGVDIRFENKNNSTQKVFVGERSLKIVLEEGRDWFDIKAVVMFGAFEIPFVRLLNYIKHNKHQLILPNGEYAVIPQAWFDEYKTLVDVCKIEDGNVVVARHYLAITQELAEKPNVDCRMKENTRNLLTNTLSTEYDLPIGFVGELRHYQQAGYNWLRLLDELALGGCLADDMGLGKTIQALCLLQWMKENKRGMSLLIVPKSLLYNWEDEATRFAPELKIYIHSGMQRARKAADFEGFDLILTSYGTLRRDKNLMSEISFNYIILDEAQAIKNPQSDTTQVCHTLQAQRFLTLTGTPLENSLTDLWSQVHFFNRNMLGSQNHFVRACKQVEKQQYYRQLLKPFMLRRHKKDVLTELPEKTIMVQWCEMSDEQYRFYKDIRNSYSDKFIENKNDANNKVNAIVLLEGLLRLRQSANHPVLADKTYTGDSGKFESVCEKLNEVVLQGDKVLIFSSFTEHLKIYRTYLDEAIIPYCYLDGSTTDRKAEVERFQNDDGVQVFLLSLKAGGVGLNLTAASYVFLLDPWWNPAAEAQAYDRAHRMGQKNQVFVYKFISRKSIEEKIIQLQKEKLQLFDTMVNGDSDIMKNLSVDDVMRLIE
jgi:hypothetical protein